MEEVYVNRQEDVSIAMPIVGAALAWVPITSIAGLIISIKEFKKAARVANGERFRSKNKIARIISAVGIGLGICGIISLIACIFCAIFYFALFIGLMSKVLSEVSPNATAVINIFG